MLSHTPVPARDQTLQTHEDCMSDDLNGQPSQLICLTPRRHIADGAGHCVTCQAVQRRQVMLVQPIYGRLDIARDKAARNALLVQVSAQFRDSWHQLHVCECLMW
jgi:hypothetical protein